MVPKLKLAPPHPMVMRIGLLLTAWLAISTTTALAKLPDAIVNTRGELKTAETEPKTQSADDLSRELSNPNTPLAKLTFENITTFYKGSLPDSDDQVGNRLTTRERESSTMKPGWATSALMWHWARPMKAAGEMPITRPPTLRYSWADF